MCKLLFPDNSNIPLIVHGLLTVKLREEKPIYRPSHLPKKNEQCIIYNKSPTKNVYKGTNGFSSSLHSVTLLDLKLFHTVQTNVQN